MSFSLSRKLILFSSLMSLMALFSSFDPESSGLRYSCGWTGCSSLALLTLLVAFAWIALAEGCWRPLHSISSGCGIES